MPNGNKDKPPIPTVPGNTTVTLIVDTANINETNKNDSVTFTDNQSDPAENPGHPLEYLSSVHKGTQIIWNGVPKSGRDIINITKVTKKPTPGNADLLVMPNVGYWGSTPNRTGSTVQGVVINTQKTGTESYTVSFNINGSATTYSIDPKLIIKT